MDLNVHYRRKMDRNYMVIDGEENTLHPHYEMRMLMENDIQGFMKLSIMPVDCHLEYCYDISSIQPLSRIYQKKKIGLKEIQTLFFSLKRQIELMEPYLMEACHLILEPEYIYIKPQTFQVYFCYHTEVVTDFHQSVRNLIQFILEKLNHEDKNGIVAVYQMYQRSLEDSITVEELLKTLFTTYEDEETIVDDDNLKEDIVTQNTLKEIKQEEIKDVWKGEVIKEAEAVTFWKEQNRKKYIRNLVLSIALLMVLVCLILLNGQWQQTAKFLICLGVMAVGILYNIWNIQQMRQEITVVSEERSEKKLEKELEKNSELLVISYENHIEVEKEDVVAGMTGPLENRENHALISENPGLWSHIQMNQYPYVIGRTKESCNAVIEFQEISRFHAEIQKREDEMWIMDLNSLNGTYVNEERLEANTPKKIKTGDKVRFSQISYTFY